MRNSFSLAYPPPPSLLASLPNSYFLSFSTPQHGSCSLAKHPALLWPNTIPSLSCVLLFTKLHPLQKRDLKVQICYSIYSELHKEPPYTLTCPIFNSLPLISLLSPGLPFIPSSVLSLILPKFSVQLTLASAHLRSQ